MKVKKKQKEDTHESTMNLYFELMYTEARWLTVSEIAALLKLDGTLQYANLGVLITIKDNIRARKAKLKKPK